MEGGADCETTLELLEGLFNAHELNIVASRLGGIACD